MPQRNHVAKQVEQPPAFECSEASNKSDVLKGVLVARRPQDYTRLRMTACRSMSASKAAQALGAERGLTLNLDSNLIDLVDDVVVGGVPFGIADTAPEGKSTAVIAWVSGT